MKLVFQIALGIFVASVVSWFMWLAIVGAGLKAVSDSVSQAAFQIAARPLAVYHAPQLVQQIGSVPNCVNFVQMSGGQRRCLEDLHPGWKIEPRK